MTGVARLSPTQQEAATKLGLTVLSHGIKVTIRCPFCPGVRTVHPNNLVNWAKKGLVPTCEAVKKQNVGTHCRPAEGQEGTTDAAIG